MSECPGADGLSCVDGWLYSSVNMMIFPANRKCPMCNDLKKRHQELHQGLDELLACYLIQTKRTISQTPLMEFLKWSHLMTESPTCQAHGGEDSGVAPRSTDGS